jgi:hypothetical protein
MMKHIGFATMLILGIWGCKQSPPPEVDITDLAYRKGDKIHFSGRDWVVKKYENAMWGPGPNFFSGNEEDITIDNQGYLHMKVVKRDNKWMSTEIIGQDRLGYGTYIFTVDGNFESMPDNIVLGLFTWDDNSFQTEANSEVDIEMGKWGIPSDPSTLQYGVQPINFGTLFPERMKRQSYPTGSMNGVTTHSFLWSPDSIVWHSYTGEKVEPSKQFGYWKFDKNNPARAKTENGLTSQGIVIPKPGTNTNARINLWINTWIAAGPRDGKDLEVIVRKFEYKRL